MLTWAILSTTCAAFLLLLLVLLTMLFLRLLRWQESQFLKNSARTQESNRLSLMQATDSLSETSQSQLQLLDKALALVASKDSLTYQTIQAMGSTPSASGDDTFDPSDEAEIARIEAIRGVGKAEDDLSGEDGDHLEWLKQLGVPDDLLPDGGSTS